jgi:hypothetical protein
MTVAEVLRRRTLELDGAGQPGGSGLAPPAAAAAPPAPPPAPPPPPPKRREPIAARRRAPDAPLPYLEDELPPVTGDPIQLPTAQAKVPWYKLDTKKSKRKRDEQALAQPTEVARRPGPPGARRLPPPQFERPAGIEPPPFVRQLPPLDEPESFAARRKRLAVRPPRKQAKKS